MHVALAVFWVGGGILLTVLGLRAERSTDPNEIATLARQAVFAGEKLFAPAGMLVLLAGIGMMLNTNWGWGKFWVVAGLVGYALTFVTGVAVVLAAAREEARRADHRARPGGSPETTSSDPADPARRPRRRDRARPRRRRHGDEAL